MIGNRGIDQEVQNKVDAYRGNPNALAQQYSQNQQLIDLLALQKLKSEKESAAREMQIKMGGQQMPTIAEARENEVLDLTKQELAQNTTGAMQQQQAQKQQAAKDLVERSAQMPMQSQSPMMQGVAGLPANNMSPQAMAAGGIVAFQEGGRAEDEIDPERNREIMRLVEAQRQSPEREAPVRQSEMGSLARQGIRNLIGTRTPQEVFMERQEQATRAAGYSPEERDRLERHLRDRESIDVRRFNPERRRSDALTQFLLGAAGRTGIGSVLAGGGAGVVNYENAMDAAERAAMVDRQKQEAGIIDVGPAARLKGMQLGSEGERTAMTGLAQGTGDAVRLEQLQAAAGRAGINPEDRRITQAYQALNQNPEIRALIKTREASGRAVDDPENITINRRIYAIAEPIFRGRGLDPSLFIPAPPEASEPAPAQPGFWSMVGRQLTPSFGGGASQPAPRPSSGGVDPNNPLLRTN
jgi:hypothetical protein